MSVTFDFDPREGHGAFLTPVYFDRRVLVKYAYDDRFIVEFASETYGSIYADSWHLAFGLNSEDTVLAWLGDLQRLDLGEQHHWRANNVPSQHDIRSEWYQGQIEATFTDPPLGVQCLNAIARWTASCARRHGVAPYKPQNLDERLEDIQRFRTLVVNREDDFIRFVSELNEVINENVDNQALRSFLARQAVETPAGTKGNKLLEKMYAHVFGDTANLIAPFFYLYDLRLWADHAMGDDKLKTIAAKLGVADTSDFSAIMTALLTSLRDSAAQLEALYGAEEIEPER